MRSAYFCCPLRSLSEKGFSVFSVPPWCVFILGNFNTEITERSEFTRRDPIFPTDSFAGWDLTKECALAHERAIALMGENLKQKRLPTNPCQEPLRNLPMPSLTVGLLTRSS